MTLSQQLELMDMRQAAAYRGLHYETFRYYVLQGRGPEAAARVGNRVFFLVAALDAWKQTDRRKREKQ